MSSPQVRVKLLREVLRAGPCVLRAALREWQVWLLGAGASGDSKLGSGDTVNEAFEEARRTLVAMGRIRA